MVKTRLIPLTAVLCLAACDGPPDAGPGDLPGTLAGDETTPDAVEERALVEEAGMIEGAALRSESQLQSGDVQVCLLTPSIKDVGSRARAGATLECGDKWMDGMENYVRLYKNGRVWAVARTVCGHVKTCTVYAHSPDPSGRQRWCAEVVASGGATQQVCSNF